MENSLNSILYKKFAKNIFFQLDPEFVHTSIVKTGELMGNSYLIKNFLKNNTTSDSSFLKQEVSGIEFKNPLGLAAGFDYEARLTQVLPSLDFGFETIGTITNMPYTGNEKPRLGRLPKSKSLMVNKGFKNNGAKKTAEKLSKLNFEIPLGISIGRTNSLKLKTQKESIGDILSSFNTFESSGVNNLYYELNISCPNLYGSITFYPPKNLGELLTEIDKLKLKKPIFAKMPIEKTDLEVLKMLDVITKHNIKGVIFGNLQKNWKDSSIDQSEVSKFKVGYFSGKPTEKRSNELITLAHNNYGEKLTIIGCGGVFNAFDAYKKIKLGATLVQLITGLIYEGPFLVSQINKDLIELLKKDGFKNISEAIGIETN